MIASMCLLGLLAALGASTAVRADFPSAMKDFNEGRYDAAREEFLMLAALGDGASQFNLGAMAMQGQGVPKDLAAAVGWLEAASDNGSSRLAPEKLADLRSRLNDEQRKAADDILRHYGRTGLQETALPIPGVNAHCPDVVAPKLSRPPRADAEYYPRNGRLADQNGFVMLQLTVGIDGVPHDPEVLMSVPSPDFAAKAVDIWMTSRWTAATQADAAVEYKVTVKAQFLMIGGGVLWDVPALKAIRTTALTGDPTAQYQIGLAATLDSSLGIPGSQAYALLVSAAQGGQPRAQYWAANRFMNLSGCSTGQKKDLWLRAAARGGDGAAQLALARDLLRGQPSAEQLAQARALLEQAAQSPEFYVEKHVAALMAASPLAALRDPGLAKTVAERLMKSPIDSDPQAYEAAAAAYAANREFWEAAAKEQTAIKKATLLQWNTALMQERLSLYHHSRPWTGDLFALPPIAGAAASPK